MNRIKSLLRVLSGRTVLRAVLALLLVAACSPLFAQRADVRSAGVYYVDGGEDRTKVLQATGQEKATETAQDLAQALYCNWGTAPAVYASYSTNTAVTVNRSFVTTPNPTSNQNSTDPWVSSALIEYDQPYPNTTVNDNKYPNHCLALCMQVVCTNRPMAQATYSIAFPLQNITFDIVKYYNGKNIKDAEGTPAIRSIDLYPDINNNTAKCGSYRCPGGPNDGYTCTAPLYEKRGTKCYNLGTTTEASDQCSDTLSADKSGNCANKNCNYIIFNNDGQPSGSEIPFCAAWDGSYDIAGEFGKSNGDFAFRATVATDFPGDNVAVDKIEFNSTIAYPGENQIPIQVDVTNVHTVRSTPTVVGDITAVPAQPYTFAYRLSKDADVRIAILDASSDDSKSYGTSAASTITGEKQIVRTLVDWQPRVGEGIKGVESDKQIVESDSWDGRSDSGMLLPAGNYIAAIQAKTQDEWPGIDFSRAVTRQVSLDPLKLTDIAVTGLNKKSTAYASISYVPTEASKVYWNIYTPGTTFTGNTSGTNTINTNSSQPTGTAPALVANTGTLVYSSAEDRTSRMNFTSKWDGLCGVETGCTRTYAKNEKMSTGTTCPDATCTEQFAYGAPMPDGNYVYVLWAEIPYNGCYYNALGGTANTPRFDAGAACAASDANNNKQFTGVKTLSYYTGQVAIERGFVDITIQPVSYSTVGSSPTAYGLDPFIFKYSIVREANVVAKVTNSAGVDVKYLTPKTGITQVAQQMNTLSWDGRDDQGRMVTPGTYMFVVESKDAMFPAVTNKASAVFPVDMYRVVDVATTDVYGDSDAKATISYMLSKAMNVQINIYNKDVVIPAYNTKGGDYSDFVVNNSVWATGYATDLTSVPVYESGITTPFATLTNPSIGTKTNLTGTANPYTRDTVTVVENPNYVVGSTVTTELQYYVTLKREIGMLSTGVTSWPPRICNKTTDADVFNAAGYVDPAAAAAKDTKCIYVNDTTFTNYPANAQAAASGVVDVRLQPIKTFDRTSTKTGDGIMITEEWDAVSFYNPTSTQQPGACKGKTNLKDCPYETVPDGQYPFFISARSNEPFDRYYAQSGETYKENGVDKNYIVGAPFKTAKEVKQEDFWYATDKVSSKINITRGSVYFLDGSTTVYPNAPQLFNASTGPVFIPPYEIDFSVSRAATVEVAIVALKPNMCYDTTGKLTERNAAAGAVCKYLSTTTIANTGNFDPNTVRKVYWDGTDNNGVYVKPGIYEVRLIAKNYPDPHLYQETVKVIRINADLLKVFDLLEADGYALNQRDTDMKIGYQISVPMKVAIQIFKPGTTIYDYQKGTLRNPTTGTEVKDIHEVLVKAIVGIRPATTLIEEVWDGRDYAQQEVPDGTYPFRFVTALDSADIDSVTGEILGSDDTSADAAKWSIEKVADTYQYQNLHKATVAIGDGRFVCEDWEKTVFFYPNPLRVASKGTLEITKMPVPGTVSIKYFNLAGDLVRDSNYTCVDANNYQVTMGSSLQFNPDNTPEGSVKLDNDGLDAFPNIRNAALRCKWDRTNQHGKKVARGVYFGLVDFRAQNGREHCQKVVKILVP
ncbi:hypothetical protein [Candidatus Avelusimicrobium fimicolum]|uniref:hypothetical protein n=1 Tax=Candidatus Avelusimicrobium fimicolum TaxID=3416216 RepID=UPI003D12C6FD